MSELALGNTLGMLKVGHDVSRVIESVLGMFYMLSNLCHVPLQNVRVMNPISQPLINKFGTESMKGANIFSAWLTKSVASRCYSDEKPKEKDMLYHFHRCQKKGGKSEHLQLSFDGRWKCS